MKINTIKRLFHGTDREFDTFDFTYAKSFKDFGKGFYLTSNFQQAQSWAQNKAREKDTAYIYSYCVDVLKENEWKVLELLHYDKTWIDFICRSRIEGMETDYDIIYDRIADNRYSEISNALHGYNNNKLSYEKVIDLIRWNGYNADQYCFKNERAISLLKDSKVIVQYRDENDRWIQAKR